MTDQHEPVGVHVQEGYLLFARRSVVIAIVAACVSILMNIGFVHYVDFITQLRMEKAVSLSYVLAGRDIDRLADMDNIHYKMMKATADKCGFDLESWWEAERQRLGVGPID
jgi:hypothetical protein